jgi:DNA-binding response OmpR family regulator
MNQAGAGAQSILIVDDDVELVGLLGFAIEAAGYVVHNAFDGREAIALVRDRNPDLVILDVNLPNEDGFRVLAEIRRFTQVPVIMLTVRSTEEDEIQGLDLGADDYLRKPFSPRALLARVRSHLRRRVEPGEEAVLTLGEIALDVERCDLRVGDGETQRLSPLESRLMKALLAHRGRPVDPDRLVEAVWLGRDSADRELLKQVVHRLRRKLAAAGGQGAWIEYIAGAGYAIAASPAG